MKNISVIGGGTGSFTVLSGLKRLQDIHLTAIVASTDSGGSSGRLVDEFGYLPPGDLRQCLVALAENDEEQQFLRELFLYRFDRGCDGLKGHNFGNLFLTALRDIYGDEIKAVEIAEKLLGIKGKVYPVSLEKCDLFAKYENGEIICGQHHIDKPNFPHDCRLRISNLYTEPKVRTHSKVIDAIENSDIIVIGPGDLYTSLIANLIMDGVSQAVCRSKAKVVYVVNLVTKFGQTFGFKVSDHVSEIQKYLGKRPDYILINSTELPESILEKYKLENAYPVEDDLGDSLNIIRTDLLANEEVTTISGDVLQRSLIRHDEDKVAGVIAGIFQV